MRACFLPGLALLLAGVPAAAQTNPHLHVTVALARDVATAGVSGRLLIFMSSKPDLPLHPTWGSDPQELWIAAKEVPHLAPGASVDLDADDVAFPQPFSKAPGGEYRIRAVLDTNHTYAYREDDDDGDLRSEISVQKLPAANITLTLTQTVRDPPLALPHAQLLDFESHLLSKFWGRPIHIRGLIVLPPSYDKNKSQTYPTTYWTHGFGGSLGGIATYELQYYYPYMERREAGDDLRSSGSILSFRHPRVCELRKQRAVGRCAGEGTHSRARTQVPHGWQGEWPLAARSLLWRLGGIVAAGHLPRCLRRHLAHCPRSRRLPRLRSCGPDQGEKHLSQSCILRANGREMAMEDYARREAVLGEYGGQMSSFEAVFSPRGADGRPMRLFDRVTGEIDPQVAKAWERYDIARILRQNWRQLGSKLNGKIHLYVGTADNYYLDEPARLLQQTIKELGGKATFVFLPGRTHANVYENGIAERIWREMEHGASRHKQSKVFKAPNLSLPVSP